MDSKVHRQWSKVRTCVMCSSFYVFPIKKHHFELTGRRANSNTKCDPAIKPRRNNGMYYCLQRFYLFVYFLHIMLMSTYVVFPTAYMKPP